MSAAVAPAATPIAARRLGRYRLVREIGRGSTGVVHLAVDEAADRPVALKILAIADAGQDAAEARERFLGEARAAQRLAHPDIATVFDAGESAATAWLAIELLHGCDLGRYTRPARLLPEAVALGIVERLARALAHAHARGVVHRDVKPGNVVVDLARGTVKLTDFGVAGLADSARTRTGVVLGTPAYMAPEQLAGAEADARSDLYSLGALAFHLLAGRLPHEGATLGDLLRRIAQEAAPDLRTLRPELPPGVAEAVAHALQRRPAQRPADAASFADTVAALRHSVTPAAPGRGTA